ncbi:RluA family pseudouridine synthase [Loigolactobacillus iwatensis]|uniref:RluA family pseudouridine synthase n=1 Tax=Loigolactobacillus iwatensis TaxID=1267156 RepID=UPI000F7E8D40|nr:RluA family pseudouridine synthase [Loigolactobacillus iwatensis]
MQAWHYRFRRQPTATELPLRDLLRREWLIPKSVYHQLRVKQHVTVNGIYQSVNTLIHPGDLIELTFEANDFSTPLPNYHAGQAEQTAVLYETSDILAVDKPIGQKTHPNQPWENNSLFNDVASYLEPQHCLPYIVHRLDMETSGVLIVAKNPVVLPILNRLIKTKRIKRHYVAWIHGQLNLQQGTIDAPIGRDPFDKRKRKVAGTNAVSAITHYKVLKQTPARTLVGIELETGRTHQIRVHFASIGHPLVGDPLYDPQGNQYLRLFLHADRLHLLTPFSYEPILIKAPLPAVFNQKNLLKKLPK